MAFVYFFNFFFRLLYLSVFLFVVKKKSNSYQTIQPTNKTTNKKIQSNQQTKSNNNNKNHLSCLIHLTIDYFSLNCYLECNNLNTCAIHCKAKQKRPLKNKWEEGEEASGENLRRTHRLTSKVRWSVLFTNKKMRQLF